MDADTLASGLAMCASLAGRTLSPEFVAGWCRDLEDLDDRLIVAALRKHRNDPDRSHFMPAPGDVRRIIANEMRQRYVRPHAVEAYAMCPADETQSAVMCREMLAALSIADQAGGRHGEYGHRKAFTEAYDRLLDVAARNQLIPEWTLSRGTDATTDRLAVRRAHDAGLIDADQAGRLDAMALLGQRRELVALDGGLAEVAMQAAGAGAVALLEADTDDLPDRPDKATVEARIAQVRALFEESGAGGGWSSSAESRRRFE